VADDVRWLRASPQLASLRWAEVAVATAGAALVLAGIAWATLSALWALGALVLAGAGVVTGTLLQRRVRTWG
jgi:hypothetical protein